MVLENYTEEGIYKRQKTQISFSWAEVKQIFNRNLLEYIIKLKLLQQQKYCTRY